jgi:hypothetical protein
MRRNVRSAPALAAALVLITIASGGCSRSSRPLVTPGSRRVSVSFTAEIDARRGTLLILPQGAASAAPQALLVEIPVVRDGIPGSGPPNTAELVTESVATVPDGCGIGLTSFEGDVRLRSFYAGARLENAHVEILSMSLTGRESCNSATPVPVGASDQYGLWSYGTLQPSPGAGSAALARWKLKLPDATSFTFSGRVVADIVDDVPPQTQATPGPGTYPVPQVVTLACTDAHVGCASTFFALGAGQPFLQYAGPITVASTTELLYYSTDPAGNAEVVHTAAYVIDTVPPAVVSVVPRDGKANVGLSDAVVVTFSEPIAASAPVVIELTQGGAPIPGAVVAQADPAVFRFVPVAPLDAASEYSVRVVAASVDDVAGNAMQADFTTRFFTVTPVELVSAPGSATVGVPGVAYDAAGNGLAVWRELTAAGYRTLTSFFTAASGTWSGPQVLATEPSTLAVPGYMSAKVVSNGTTFLAVWSKLTQVEGAIFTNGTPGSTKLLFSGNSTQDGFDVASNGARYAVVNAGTSGNVTAWVHDGSSWGIPFSVESTTGVADRPVVAPYGASGFVSAFRINSTSVYQSRYSGTSWSPPTLVPGPSGTSQLVGPVIAASGTRVMVAWRPGSGSTYANVDVGTGFAASATDIGGVVGDQQTLSAAANGSLFAVVGPGGGAVFNQTYWSGPYLLASAGRVLVARVAASNAGFTAAFTVGDNGYARPSLWVNKTAAGGGYYWLSANALSVESGSGDVRDPSVTRLNPGVAMAWAQDDGSAHQVNVRAHDGAVMGAQAVVSSPTRDGSASQVKLARSSAGEVMAVWTQDHRGGSAVFAARRTNGIWQGPELLDLNAARPAIASDGTGFMVAYGRGDLDPTFGSTTTNVVARRWTGSTFEPPVVVATDGSSPAIASDGTSYVVAAVRSGRTGVWSMVFEGGAWGAPVQRSTVPGTFANVAMGARPGEYLLAFATSGAPSGPYAVRATTSPGWVWGSSYPLDNSAVLAGPAIAAGPSGFAAVWRTAYGVTGRVLAGGAWVTNGTVLGSGDGAVSVASNGTGYLAVFSAVGGLHALEHDASSGWGVGATAVAPASTAFALAAGGGQYELITRQSDGATSSLFAIDPRRDVALGPERIEFAPESVQTSLSLVHDGLDWVALWTQQRADDAIVDALQGRWRF